MCGIYETHKYYAIMNAHHVIMNTEFDARSSEVANLIAAIK